IEADEGKGSFRDMLLKDEKVAKLLTEEELDEVMDPTNYVGKAPELTDMVVKKAKASVGKKK
ncbi:MAG TPA: adenylosuccinate lyase, partial [Methanomassiliicoccales archaeon]|nr:adenylosuccinate lyase [Methanomassiliicoccales archaeon]